MVSQQAKALILEDDVSLGQALSEALKRAGLSVSIFTKPDDALVDLRQNIYSFIIVDCLLPQTPGVDFVVRIKKEGLIKAATVILMSGVFTDKAFIKEALSKTGAVALLKKPFEIKELLDLVKINNSSLEEVSPRKALYELFSKPKASHREKRKAIERLDKVDGYDLPFIFSLLVEAHVSGHLNIVREDNQVLGVSFNDGKIVGVDVDDKDTYTGKLLIDRGFLTNDEIESVLKNKTNRKIGQTLIEENLLSPHALNIAMAEQMNIRLSKTIFKGSIQINFVSTEVESRGAEIDSESLMPFLHDWIVSKISISWLKSNYQAWGEHQLKLSPTFSITHPALKTPLMVGLPKFVNHMTSGKSLSSLIDENAFPEDQAYKALHFLLTTGLLIFDEQVIAETELQRTSRLKKLNEQCKSKNEVEMFEFIGARPYMKESEVKKICEDFIRALGPEPAKSGGSKALQDIYKQIKDRVTQTMGLMNDKEAREKYEKMLVDSELQKKIKTEEKYENVKKLLSMSQYQKALDAIREISSSNIPMDNFKLYIVWAKVGCIDHIKERAKAIKEIEFDLMQVPPEDKYSALFSYVSGLVAKAQGQTAAAKKFFEKSLSLEPGLIAAKRELNLLQIQEKQQKPKDLLNRDLSDVVSSFFKKKKGA